MVTATGVAQRSTGDRWLDAIAATEEAARRRHQRLVMEDRVQRLNRQLLGPRKDRETGEWTKKHRAGTCGLPHSERVEMGYATSPTGSMPANCTAWWCAQRGTGAAACVKIVAARARQIESLAAVTKALGYHGYSITPTFSDSRSDGLAGSYRDMMDGWTALRQSRRFAASPPTAGSSAARSR